MYCHPTPRRTRPWQAALICALMVTTTRVDSWAEPRSRGKAVGQRDASQRVDLRQWALQRRWSKPAHVARLMLKSALTPAPQFEPNSFKPRKVLDPVKAAASIDWQGAERYARRLKRVDGSGIKQTRMKAFERLVARDAKGQPLRKLYVVSELHLLDTMKGLLEGMTDAGVVESRLVLQGVRHSQQQDVISEMQRWGISARAAKVGLLKQQYRKLASSIVRKAKQNPGAQFLVVGHGGRLHSMLSRLVDQPGVPADLARRVSIVETTRKGDLRMERMWSKLKLRGASKEQRRYRFPVVDIGEHWAKVHFESPTIGQGVANSMRQHLAQLTTRGARGLDLATGRVPVLIVGYGAVGRASARMLQRMGYEVHVHDLKFSRERSRLLKQARKDGVKVHTSLQSALASSPRVIGSATGANPWTPAAVGRIPRGAVLFNLASPGELSGLLQASTGRPASGPGAGSVRFGGRALSLDSKVAPDHRDLVRKAGRNEFMVARGGQVINLATGGKEPAEYIQITRGLVWMATLKGASIIGAKPGRYQLNDGKVQGFVKDVQRDLKAAGMGPLQRPTF